MGNETQFSKARIEMLCDGIFAIAMTLLVLDLKIPELPKQTASIEIWHALGEHRMSYFAFVLTFMLAGSFWVQHHAFFHYLARATRSMALLNLVFLMFVSLLPFSTSLFAAFGPQRVAILCYFGNQFVLSLLLAAQWALARRQDLLSGSPTDPQRVRFFAFLAAFTVFTGTMFTVSIFSSSAASVVAAPGVLAVFIIRRRAEKRAKAAEEMRLAMH